jgi:murein L,D-transpeptidase YcbB/YkuD
LDTRPVYDEKTMKIITLIQKQCGIKVDGLVGPLTKIILYNELGTLNIPKIRG